MPLVTVVVVVSQLSVRELRTNALAWVRRGEVRGGVLFVMFTMLDKPRTWLCPGVSVPACHPRACAQCMRAEGPEAGRLLST